EPEQDSPPGYNDIDHFRMQARQGRQGIAESDASRAASDAQHNRLRQELQEDIAPPRANGLPEPDFPGPLGDADQHDVHDTYPPDQEGDPDDPRQHDRGNDTQAVECVQELVLRLYTEVVGLVSLESVTSPEEVDDLGAGLGNPGLGNRLRGETH